MLAFLTLDSQTWARFIAERTSQLKAGLNKTTKVMSAIGAGLVSSVTQLPGRVSSTIGDPLKNQITSLADFRKRGATQSATINVSDVDVDIDDDDQNYPAPKTSAMVSPRNVGAKKADDSPNDVDYYNRGRQSFAIGRNSFIVVPDLDDNQLD